MQHQSKTSYCNCTCFLKVPAANLHKNVSPFWHLLYACHNVDQLSVAIAGVGLKYLVDFHHFGIGNICYAVLCIQIQEVLVFDFLSCHAGHIVRVVGFVHDLFQNLLSSPFYLSLQLQIAMCCYFLWELAFEANSHKVTTKSTCTMHHMSLVSDALNTNAWLSQMKLACGLMCTCTCFRMDQNDSFPKTRLVTQQLLQQHLKGKNYQQANFEGQMCQT